MEGTTLMAKKEKTPQEIFAEQFVSEFQPKTIEDVENGLKSIFGPIFESMLTLPIPSARHLIFSAYDSHITGKSR